MKVVSISSCPWGGSYRPKAWAAVHCGAGRFEFCLWCEEESPVIRYTEPNSPVYLDSCLEVFLRPFPQKNEYLNFEMNASGALLLQVGNERRGRRFLHAEDFPGCYPEVFPFRSRRAGACGCRFPPHFCKRSVKYPHSRTRLLLRGTSTNAAIHPLISFAGIPWRASPRIFTVRNFLPPLRLSGMNRITRTNVPINERYCAAASSRIKRMKLRRGAFPSSVL